MTTNTTNTTTSADDLTAIIDRWDDLRDMLNPTSSTTDWPPAGRMADYQSQLSDDEQAEMHAQAAAERAERTALAPGERPVPIRLQVLDTITALDDALVHLADQIASSCQRPALTAPRPAGPGDGVGLAVRLAAAKDSADPRRWSFGRPDRTGLTAARWLLARVTDCPGPFRALLLGERERIDAVAAGARQRVEQALGIVRREDPIARLCPCGGPMVIRQGGEEVRDDRPHPIDPEIECTACGITWSGPGLLRLLDAA